MLAIGESFRKCQASCLCLSDPPREARPAPKDGSTHRILSAATNTAIRSVDAKDYRYIYLENEKIIMC